jgi:tetratricopeptide (TPR) repeat protein
MDDYYDLGQFSRPLTTQSAEAQVWFDRGLLWRYAFHPEETIRCFERAAAADPACAMAHWGLAYALGPFYNQRWEDLAPDELRETLHNTRRATDTALARAGEATPVERALIGALDRRYRAAAGLNDGDFTASNDTYAAAMREIYVAFPDDLDVATLFAEAMMNRTPWLLWDAISGAPAQGADTEEIVAVLGRALRLADERGVEHPGLLHLQIHALEMSPHPERALPAADALRELTPDAGHLRHMPSHIDLLCGNYHDALIANDRAIVADRKYLAREGAYNYYTLSRCHDYHFKIYAAMFLGQYGPARATADELAATLPEELLRNAAPTMTGSLEAFVPMWVHVLVRFGKWQELLDEPLPADPALYPMTTALLHYGKGVAQAALGQAATAEATQVAFTAAFARVPEDRMLFNNRCTDILAIAGAMLTGEIAYRRGAYDEAFAALRRAVALDDALPYDEPWGWMQPARHALGALLLEQGHAEEAAAVYRADLGLDDSIGRASQHPKNAWALHGYVECLRQLGNDAEAAALQPQLDAALALADVPINASCFCRMGESCCE